MTKQICEIIASSWFYYKEICYDARSHERKKICEISASSWFYYRETLFRQLILNRKSLFQLNFMKPECSLPYSQQKVTPRNSKTGVSRYNTVKLCF